MAAAARRNIGLRPGTVALACLLGGLMIAIARAASEPSITSIAPDGADLRITREGGTPPYQVERQTDPPAGAWEPVGELTTEPAATVAAAGIINGLTSVP